MSGSHTPGGVSPVDRLRAAVRDVGDTYIFDDLEYYVWAERALSAEFLAVYCPSSTSGLTEATAQIRLQGVDLILELTTVISAVTNEVRITLAKSDSGAQLRTVGDLVDSIRTNASGWKVGLGNGDRHRVTWLEMTSADWAQADFHRETLRHMVNAARPADLALQRDDPADATGNAALNALGDTRTYARLYFYDYGRALLAALRAVDGIVGADGGLTSRKKGNSSWTRGELSSRIDAVRNQAGFGIYGDAA